MDQVTQNSSEGATTNTLLIVILLVVFGAVLWFFFARGDAEAPADESGDTSIEVTLPGQDRVGGDEAPATE